MQWTVYSDTNKATPMQYLMKRVHADGVTKFFFHYLFISDNSFGVIVGGVGIQIMMAKF